MIFQFVRYNIISSPKVLVSHQPGQMYATNLNESCYRMPCTQLHVIALNVSQMRDLHATTLTWSCAGSLLVVCWSCVGHLLVMCRSCSARMLAASALAWTSVMLTRCRYVGITCQHMTVTLASFQRASFQRASFQRASFLGLPFKKLASRFSAQSHGRCVQLTAMTCGC